MLRHLNCFVQYGLSRWIGNALAMVFLVSWANVAVAEKKIIAFGDSLTQGFGLPADQGFVPQLENWLRDQGAAVRVVNAGVSGDTTQGGASRIDWTLAEPADLIIVNLGGNDMLRAIDPDVTRGNLEDILQAIRAKDLPVILVGLQAPPNFGAAYKAAFDRIYPDLAEVYGATLYPFYFNAFFAEGASPADVGGYFQADGLHPSAEGVALIVADFGPLILQELQK